MNRTTLKAIRIAFTALFVGGLLAMQAVPAFADDGSVEVKGPEVEFASEIVVQPNIKVDASMPGSGDNEQTGDSNAEFDQSVDADSGEPNATNGGTAVSGPAVAGALGIAVQTNVQVIAGWTPEGGVDQEAWNDAGADQTSGAYTGDPSADGIGSAAVSGSAVGWDTTVFQQTNVQTFVGTPSGDED